MPSVRLGASGLDDVDTTLTLAPKFGLAAEDETCGRIVVHEKLHGWVREQIRALFQVEEDPDSDTEGGSLAALQDNSESARNLFTHIIRCKNESSLRSYLFNLQKAQAQEEGRPIDPALRKRVGDFVKTLYERSDEAFLEDRRSRAGSKDPNLFVLKPLEASGSKLPAVPMGVVAAAARPRTPVEDGNPEKQAELRICNPKRKRRPNMLLPPLEERAPDEEDPVSADEREAPLPLPLGQTVGARSLCVADAMAGGGNPASTSLPALAGPGERPSFTLPFNGGDAAPGIFEDPLEWAVRKSRGSEQRAPSHRRKQKLPALGGGADSALGAAMLPRAPPGGPPCGAAPLRLHPALRRPTANQGPAPDFAGIVPTAMPLAATISELGAFAVS